ncbi:uncharacterized protein ACO6RY_06914 [Pungitius sinensis]
MSRGNNQRNWTDAPQCGPGPPPKTFHLKKALTRANEEVYRLTYLVEELKSCKKDSEIERDSFCLVIQDGKLATSRLEKSLETANNRIKILESHQVSTGETDHSRDMETENLHLLERLRQQEEKMAEAQLISQRMAQAHEAELSDQKIQNLNLIKEIEGLTLRLTESRDLTASSDSWQQKYHDLEKKTTKDLQDLQVKYQKMATEVENLTLQKFSETLKVNKDKEGILQKLRETQEQLISEEEKYKDLESRTVKELNHKQQILETRVTALYSDNVALEEELNKQRAINCHLEADNTLLSQWKEGMVEIQMRQEKDIQQISNTLQQMKDEVNGTNQIAISKIKQLQDENTLLENICLDLKKKKRGIFGRRMQDRQTEIDKMKRKMQDEETKRSERSEKKSSKQKTLCCFFIAD